MCESYQCRLVEQEMDLRHWVLERFTQPDTPGLLLICGVKEEAQQNN
jgi:hypothetical protein